jgi:hypothetical protein
MQPFVNEFDPYCQWLGIPAKDQPPNHYRLLAIELFEPNPGPRSRQKRRRADITAILATGIALAIVLGGLLVLWLN